MWLIKVHRNPAPFQTNAVWQVLKFLGQNLGRRLNQELRPFQALFLELHQNPGDFLAAPAFVMTGIPIRKPAQVSNQSIAISQTIAADEIRDAGRHNLLRPAAADTEQEFDRSPVHVGAGKGLQLANNFVDLVEPSWFCWHGCLTMLVRICAKYNILE